MVKVKAIFTQNKFIIEVSIKKGNSLYYINKYGRSSKGCYIRVGTSCRSMTEEQIENTYTSGLKQKDKGLILGKTSKRNGYWKIN